jgi:hypothetical protein
MGSRSSIVHVAKKSPEKGFFEPGIRTEAGQLNLVDLRNYYKQGEIEIANGGWTFKADRDSMIAGNAHYCLNKYYMIKGKVHQKTYKGYF